MLHRMLLREQSGSTRGTCWDCVCVCCIAMNMIVSCMKVVSEKLLLHLLWGAGQPFIQIATRCHKEWRASLP